MPVMGRDNIRWEKRKSLVNNLKPHLVCAVENQNSEMYMKQNSRYYWSFRELQRLPGAMYVRKYILVLISLPFGCIKIHN